MLSIGDFARFAGVTVRMLRHYDESLLGRAHQLVATWRSAPPSCTARSRPTGPLAWYDMRGDGIRFGACLPGSLAGEDFDRVRLESAPRAVVTTYTGPIARISEAWQGVAAHLAEAGLEPAGVCREVYHSVPTDGDWVIELQQPVA